MTGTLASEYHDLEHESSSQILEHDSRRVLGRYEEAAYHMLQAGLTRQRMGQLCWEAGDHTQAVQDGLSAAACFLLATACQRATEVLAWLQQMEADGQFPADRADLRAALQAHTQELTRLRLKVEQFRRSCAPEGQSAGLPGEGMLRSFLDQVRDLAGLPELHLTIFRQAAALGQQDLATRHLRWAVAFDGDDAKLTSLLAFHYMAIGRPGDAVALGSDFLARHPANAAAIRVILACALATGSPEQAPDQERAIEVLRPLLPEQEADLSIRAAALALAATLHYELGGEAECVRLGEVLDQLAGTAEVGRLHVTLASFRSLIPRPVLNGLAGARPGVRRFVPREDRLRLFRMAMEECLRLTFLS